MSNQNPNQMRVQFTNPSYYCINENHELVINPEFTTSLYGEIVLTGFVSEFFGETFFVKHKNLVCDVNPNSDPNFRFIQNEECEQKIALSLDQIIEEEESGTMYWNSTPDEYEQTPYNGPHYD